MRMKENNHPSFVESAPDTLTVWVVLRKAPPLPFLPADVHGKEVVVLPMLYAGDIGEGLRVIEPLSTSADPSARISVRNPSPHGRARSTRYLRRVPGTTGSPMTSLS
jgi:hypothetical protein